jgi:hypothetical protein
MMRQRINMIPPPPPASQAKNWGVRQIYEGDFNAAARCSQKSFHRLLIMFQRRPIILFAPLTVQCIPECFKLCPITVQHPASSTSEPTKRPSLLKSSYRILLLFFSKISDLPLTYRSITSQQGRTRKCATGKNRSVFWCRALPRS